MRDYSRRSRRAQHAAWVTLLRSSPCALLPLSAAESCRRANTCHRVRGQSRLGRSRACSGNASGTNIGTPERTGWIGSACYAAAIDHSAPRGRATWGCSASGTKPGWPFCSIPTALRQICSGDLYHHGESRIGVAHRRSSRHAVRSCSGGRTTFAAGHWVGTNESHSSNRRRRTCQSPGGGRNHTFGGRRWPNRSCPVRRSRAVHCGEVSSLFLSAV
jgi:hypothetical protein